MVKEPEFFLTTEEYPRLKKLTKSGYGVLERIAYNMYGTDYVHTTVLDDLFFEADIV